MHRLLLNSSSDKIIKLSTDWNILEFNPEAENFFGKKRDEALQQNFIRMFVPEHLQKKTEKNLNELLKKALDNKFKMQVITATGNTQILEWSANLLFNNQKLPSGIMIISKNKDSAKINES
jgi:PAS domain S-box-containing protein